jgi:hypothetical protein
MAWVTVGRWNVELFGSRHYCRCCGLRRRTSARHEPVLAPGHSLYAPLLFKCALQAP